MSIPREGSRDTDKGILVSCVPDWCWVQVGSSRVLVPFRITAKQADDANTAPTVRQQGKRSHTSGSIITKCQGDEAGNGLGVKSGTKESICWPITWSRTVRIEGKNAVRHTDLWAMNNGNTIGKLAYMEDVKPYEEPESKVKSYLPPSVDDLFYPHNPSEPSTQVAQAATGTATDVLPSAPETVMSTEVAAAGATIAIPAMGWGSGAGAGAASAGAAGAGAAGAGGTFLGSLAMVGTGVGAFIVAMVWPTPLNTGEDEALERLRRLPRPVPVPGADTTDGTQDNVKIDTIRITRSGNPCAALACGSGGKYKGGAHGCMKGPTGDGLDSHHTPADDISPLPRDMGPAIQMEPSDHRLTASYGSGRAAIMYRDAQQRLINEGNFTAATAMDIADITTKFGAKYTSAITQMELYTACLKQHGLIN